MVEILKNIVIIKVEKTSSTNVTESGNFFRCHQSVKKDTGGVKLHCKFFLFHSMHGAWCFVVALANTYI